MRRELAASPLLLSDFQRLASSASFRSLDEGIQAAGIAAVARFARPPDYALAEDAIMRGQARRTLVSLLRSPGFAQLAPGERNDLLAYVGGRNPFLSTPARDALAARIDSLSFALASGSTQATALRRFLQEQDSVPNGVPYVAQTRARATIDGITGPFLTRTHGPANNPPGMERYRISIEGRDIEVMMPTDPRAKIPLDVIAGALAAVPAELRDRIDRVDVSKYPAPPPREYANMSADGRTITVFPSMRGQPQNFFDQVMIHEAAHLFADEHMGEHLDEWVGRRWQAAMAQDRFVPSKYAKTEGAAEDFAESVTLYLAARGTPFEAELRALMPNRFAFLDAHLFG